MSLSSATVIQEPDDSPRWAALGADLDAAHVNVLQISAGRVEWTAFDWDQHPEAAAAPGGDRIAHALQQVGTRPDGTRRDFELVVDALIPNWIASDPSVAGRTADGTAAQYAPSASAIATGAVGQRYVDYAVALATRYKPMGIIFTDLRLDDETFGDDDLALYRQMTGAKDWPRDQSGRLRTTATEIGAWRSDVLAGLLGRVRAALDGVTDQVGHRVELGVDVRVDWKDPAAGRPEAGHDYRKLAAKADRLVLWAYLGTDDKTPADVGRLVSGVATVVPVDRFTVSVGLWQGADSANVVGPARLAQAVAAADKAGSLSTNVTPRSLMSPDHWRDLAQVWPRWP